MAVEDDGEVEQNVKREKPVVRPEEIPPVPENRFLLRRDMPTQEEPVKMLVLYGLINRCSSSYPSISRLLQVLPTR